MWLLRPLISVLGKLRQEDCREYETSLGDIARPCLTKMKQKEKENRNQDRHGKERQCD